MPYTPDLSAARRQPAHLAARAGQVRARAAELGRDGRRPRDRSGVPEQHGASAHDAGVASGPAHRLRQRHLQARSSTASRCSGHGGGIDGFSRRTPIRRRATSATSCCSTATHSPDAMRRISQLAVRYLKADVEPPPKTDSGGPGGDLAQLRGLLPRRQPAQPGVRVRRVADGRADHHRRRRVTCTATPVFGSPRALIPVSRQPVPSRRPIPSRRACSPTDDAGTMVLTGG